MNIKTIPGKKKELLTNDGKLFHSKLKSMRVHLQGLLSKRARLSQEIILLKKSLLEKQKHYENALKSQLGVKNEGELLIQEDFQQELELYSILKALDAEASLIGELLSSYSEVEPDTRFDKYGLKDLGGEKLDIRDYKSPMKKYFLLDPNF